MNSALQQTISATQRARLSSGGTGRSCQAHFETRAGPSSTSGVPRRWRLVRGRGGPGAGPGSDARGTPAPTAGVPPGSVSPPSRAGSRLAARPRRPIASGRSSRPGHQARSPSSTRAAGSITSRIRVASIRIDAARATPIIFISSMLRVMKMANTETITAAALVITPAVSVMPRSTASRAGQAAYGVLPDAGQDEHVVVHRQPDQDTITNSGIQSITKPGLVKPSCPAKPAVLEDQREDAERDSHRQQVQRATTGRHDHAAEGEGHHHQRQQQHEPDHAAAAGSDW